MTRSPYWLAMHRGADAEGGGVADLQTDVMRFMAILAICLVVIFALVQSIPLRPSQPVPEPVPEAVAEAVPEPTPAPVQKPAPAPEAAPVPAPQPEVVEQPVPEPAVTPPPPAPPAQDGFTLRFESDRTLTRLVARGVVGLYAIGNQQTLRLNVNESRMSFWEASTPNQFHEMDRGTVPADVVRALLRIAEVDITSIKWGVTLPADMLHDLDGYLGSATGGALVIGANGKLRLEQ